MHPVFKEIRIVLIDASGNPRGIQDTVKDTAFNANVEENGVLQPITVAPMTAAGLYPLVFGGRRLAALLAAGRETVIAQVLDAAPPADEMLLDQLSENMHRADLHAWDLLQSIDRLVAAGWNGTRLAKRLGEQESTVCRWIAVSKHASADIRDRIRAGTLSLSSAYDLCRIPPESQQAVLASEPSDTRLTREALARKIRRVQRGQRVGTPGTVPSKIVARLGRAQTVTFAARDLSLEVLVQWLGELLARATQAQAQGMDISGFALALKRISAAPHGATP